MITEKQLAKRQAEREAALLSCGTVIGAVLQNWKTFNAWLMATTTATPEQDFDKLWRVERGGRRRTGILVRLPQRKNRLRHQREMAVVLDAL